MWSIRVEVCSVSRVGSDWTEVIVNRVCVFQTTMKLLLLDLWYFAAKKVLSPIVILKAGSDYLSVLISFFGNSTQDVHIRDRPSQKSRAS